MHRFFSDGLGEPGARVLLAQDETHHLVHVLRAKPGDEIALFDGSGREAVARFVSVENGRAEVQVVSVRGARPDVRVEVTIAGAIPEGPRMADLVRSCTEVGVARVLPMICERSVVKFNRSKRPKRSKEGRRGPPAAPALAGKLRRLPAAAGAQDGGTELVEGAAAARLLRVAREAARQSRRAHVPEITPVATFDEVVSTADGFGLSLMADASSQVGPLREALDPGPPPGNCLVLVGPEGGFTEREVATASEAGCRPVRLDCPVMRVETAAPVLAAIVIFACS